MKQLKENIGFLLICLLFGALSLIAINGVSHTNNDHPDRIDMVYTSPSIMDIMPIMSENEVNSTFADEGIITYTVDRDAQIYDPGSDDIVLKPRSLLHNVQYVDDTETVTATTPNPKDIIDGIKGAESWTDLLGYESAIYAFIILIGGWLSSFIPGLNNISSGVYRVLVFAILVVAGGLVLGFGNIWQGAIAYFFSTSMYEIFIKKAVPSPRPSDTK